MNADDTDPEPRQDEDTTPEPLDGGGAVETRRLDPLAVVGCVLSFLMWPAGLVLSVLARRRIRRTGGSGGDLATVGIAVGAAEGVLTVVLLLSVWAALDRAADIAERPFDTLERTTERMIEAEERVAERDRRVGDPFRSPDGPGRDDFQARADRMDEWFERSSERMHDDFEHRADRMDESFERSSERMHDDFEHRADRMDEWFERGSERMHDDYDRDPIVP